MSLSSLLEAQVIILISLLTADNYLFTPGQAGLNSFFLLINEIVILYKVNILNL